MYFVCAADTVILCNIFSGLGVVAVDGGSVHIWQAKSFGRVCVTANLTTLIKSRAHVMPLCPNPYVKVYYLSYNTIYNNPLFCRHILPKTALSPNYGQFAICRNLFVQGRSPGGQLNDFITTAPDEIATTTCNTVLCYLI